MNLNDLFPPKRKPEALQIRIDPLLKREAELAAAELDISMTKLVEGALKWFLMELAKQGKLRGVSHEKEN